MIKKPSYEEFVKFVKETKENNAFKYNSTYDNITIFELKIDSEWYWETMDFEEVYDRFCYEILNNQVIDYWANEGAF